MGYMFREAAAFNQSVSFDTSKVTNVRAYICLEPNSAIDSDSLPTYYQMEGMFLGADAFNQPLSFDTAEVGNVRVTCFSSTPVMRDQILISSNLLSDGGHVRESKSLQSATIFRYGSGYTGESVLFWSPIVMRNQILIYQNLLSDARHV